MLPRWDERTRSASRPLCPYLIPRNAAVIIWPMGRQAERLSVAVHVSDSVTAARVSAVGANVASFSDGQFSTRARVAGPNRRRWRRSSATTAGENLHFWYQTGAAAATPVLGTSRRGSAYETLTLALSRTYSWRSSPLSSANNRSSRCFSGFCVVVVNGPAEFVPMPVLIPNLRKPLTVVRRAEYFRESERAQQTDCDCGTVVWLTSLWVHAIPRSRSPMLGGCRLNDASTPLPLAARDRHSR